MDMIAHVSTAAQSALMLSCRAAIFHRAVWAKCIQNNMLSIHTTTAQTDLPQNPIYVTA